MIYIFALVASALVIIESVVLFAAGQLYASLERQNKRVWQLVDELEADKRALTESLCRAEGKPFIPPRRETMQPSEGWFDAKPKIEVRA